MIRQGLRLRTQRSPFPTASGTRYSRPLSGDTLPYRNAQSREEGKGALQQASQASGGLHLRPHPLQGRGQESSNKPTPTASPGLSYVASTCIFTAKSRSWGLRPCTQVGAPQQRGEGPLPLRLALVCVGGRKGGGSEGDRLLKAGFGQAPVAKARQQAWEKGEHEGGAKRERKPDPHKARLSVQGSGMEQGPEPGCFGPPWTPESRAPQPASPALPGAQRSGVGARRWRGGLSLGGGGAPTCSSDHP